MKSKKQYDVEIREKIIEEGCDNVIDRLEKKRYALLESCPAISDYNTYGKLIEDAKRIKEEMNNN